MFVKNWNGPRGRSEKVGQKLASIGQSRAGARGPENTMKGWWPDLPKIADLPADRTLDSQRPKKPLKTQEDWSQKTTSDFANSRAARERRKHHGGAVQGDLDGAKKTI